MMTLKEILITILIISATAAAKEETGTNNFLPYGRKGEIQYDREGNKMMMIKKEYSSSSSLRRSMSEFYVESTNKNEANPNCDVDHPVGACMENDEIFCVINKEACSGNGNTFLPAETFVDQDAKCLLCRDDDDAVAAEADGTNKEEKKSGGGKNWGLIDEIAGNMGGGEENYATRNYVDSSSGTLMTTLIVCLIVVAFIIFGVAIAVRRERWNRAVAEATGVGLPDDIIDRNMAFL